MTPGPPPAVNHPPVEFSLVWQPGPAGFREALAGTTEVVVTSGPVRDPAWVVTWIGIRSTDGCFDATVIGVVSGTPPSVGAEVPRHWAPAQVSPECRLRLESAARATDVPGATLVELDLAVVNWTVPDGPRNSLLLRALFRDRWGQERAWFMGADWAP